jgi:adenylate kinase family enzyme
MSDYLDFLQEVNYFLSEGNKYYNFKNFTNNNNGKLFIVGLSGSGKTTLGKELAIKFKAEYIQLDDIDRSFRNEISKRLEKPKWDKRVNTLVLDKMKTFIQDRMKEKGRQILEGIHITFQDNKFFKDKAVIIIETSLLISTIRAYNRDIEKYYKKRGVATRTVLLKTLLINQKEIIKKLKEFEKVMEGK